PESDRPKFMKWFSGMSRVRSAAGIFKLLPMMNRTIKYLQDQFVQVRKNPRPGLITSLVEAEAEGDRLQQDELLSTALLLLLAGHETTLHLLSNSLLTLLQLEDEKLALMTNWAQADATIDEILRWTSVVHIAKPRFVTRDRKFHGQMLNRGETIIPCLGSANFDPEVFTAPTEFQRNRTPNRHMTFGNGPHVCLGMSLARAETRIALQAIFEKWPQLVADFRLSQPDFGRRIGMRTLNTLMLKRNA
ncbi:MAG: cytochrome P450, partial [Pirellulaceae bacterium]|nr:cytochrome P450 [Pirellulaceae bacterium]